MSPASIAASTSALQRPRRYSLRHRGSSPFQDPFRGAGRASRSRREMGTRSHSPTLAPRASGVASTFARATWSRRWAPAEPSSTTCHMSISASAAPRIRTATSIRCSSCRPDRRRRSYRLPRRRHRLLRQHPLRRLHPRRSRMRLRRTRQSPHPWPRRPPALPLRTYGPRRRDARLRNRGP
jgi:hypothetical protein